MFVEETVFVFVYVLYARCTREMTEIDWGTNGSINVVVGGASMES